MREMNLIFQLPDITELPKVEPPRLDIPGPHAEGLEFRWVTPIEVRMSGEYELNGRRVRFKNIAIRNGYANSYGEDFDPDAYWYVNYWTGKAERLDGRPFDTRHDGLSQDFLHKTFRTYCRNHAERLLPQVRRHAAYQRALFNYNMMERMFTEDIPELWERYTSWVAGYRESMEDITK